MTQKYTVTSGTFLSISRARSRISGFLGIANTVHGRAWTQPDYPTPPCRARPPGLLRVAVDPVRRERQDGPRAVVWRPGDEPSWGPMGDYSGVLIAFPQVSGLKRRSWSVGRDLLARRSDLHVGPPSRR